MKLRGGIAATWLAICVFCVAFVGCSGDDDERPRSSDAGPPDVIAIPLDACPDGACSGPPPLLDVPLETHASVFGRVVDANGAALGGYTIEATDIPGSPRGDVVLTTAADGSFRLRLTSIPETAVEGTPPAHVLLAFKLANRLTAVRDVYLHPGEVLDVGSVALVERDPKVTVIGPAGGVATDTSGEIEVTIPPGALSANISVQITPFRKRAHFPVPLPDVTTTMYGFELSPDGTSFAQPVTVRVAVWSPELGIFLSADAFAYHDARGTLWSWPNQNPVNLSDPSGNLGENNGAGTLPWFLRGIEGLNNFDMGVRTRAQGIDLMHNESTFELGLSMYLCGSEQMVQGFGQAIETGGFIVNAADIVISLGKAAAALGGGSFIRSDMGGGGWADRADARHGLSARTFTCG